MGGTTIAVLGGIVSLVLLTWAFVLLSVICSLAIATVQAITSLSSAAIRRLLGKSA